MKKALRYALVACAAAVLVTGCGSSSSDDNNGNLNTQDQSLDSYCLNNPQDAQCQGADQDQQNNGNCNNNNNSNVYCYPQNNNGQYPESQFGFAGGACQCDPGFMPVRNEQGGLECLKKETVIVTDWLLTVSFSSGNRSSCNNGCGSNRSWDRHETNFVLNQGGQTIEQIRPAHGNCYTNLPVSCSLANPYGSCAHVSQNGTQAVCVPVDNSNTQGLCVNQSIPTQ